MSEPEISKSAIQATATSPTADEDSKGTSYAVADNGNVIENGLQRGLKSRHLVMISFGGVVGASIWYGTGFAVAYSGPVGALICFFIVGIDVFFVMQCLGELSTLFPIPGAFIELAGRFVDPALVFSVGYNYWYLWVTNIAGDFNASSIIMGYWTSAEPSYGWILIWWAFYQVTTLLGVVFWGEMEFYFACWKLLCILGGFLCAILLNTGAIGGEYIGFRYWKDPGPIANGINGFGQSFLLAAVYYCGTEMLALTAAESKHPERDVPKAIKQTFWRVLILFMGLVFFAGILVPSNSPDLLTAATKSGKSPWTIAFKNAGAPQLGNVVNVVMITAQFSSMNSALYVASRSLATLAFQGRAPRFFAKTTKNGTPVNSLVFCNALGLIAMLNYKAGPGKVFTYLVDISGSATYIAWAVIGVTHIRFRRAWAVQGHSTTELPYKALFYPYGTWFVVFINTFLTLIAGYSVFIDGFDAVGFVVNYIVVAVFVVLFVGWKIIKRTKMVPLMEVDLLTGRRDISQEQIEKEIMASTGKHVVFDVVGTCVSYEAFFDGIEARMGERLRTATIIWALRAFLDRLPTAILPDSVDGWHSGATQVRNRGDAAFMVGEYRKLAARPDVQECWARLREAGFTVWAVTTGDAARVQRYLANTGVELPTENFVTCDDLGVTKPSLEVYEHVLNKFPGADEKWFAAAHMWEHLGSKAGWVGFKAAWTSDYEKEPVTEVFGEVDVLADSLVEMADKIIAASNT
ncbi:hypothetical protein ZTR_07611 [Talaromyces verruculosus]|nr:hypothetical protein ZTR_07611 [Talaromyces verruculosus]